MSALISRLDVRTVIDVGAERGAFAEALLHAGSTEMHAIEPEPANADFLRGHFQDDPRVSVHEYAISDVDGPLELHRSTHPSGAPMSYGHTVLARPDTDEIAWRETISVRGRSLASLVEAGDLPSRVGILKIDTEGNDLAVVAGMGDLLCQVIMVEHWVDLPRSLGLCPWTIDDLTSILSPRGFSRFAFLEHRGDFVLLKWNDAEAGPGRMGNILFVHDSLEEALAPVLLDSALNISEQNVALAESYAAEAHARLAVIQHLERQCAGKSRDLWLDGLMRRLRRDARA